MNGKATKSTIHPSIEANFGTNHELSYILIKNILITLMSCQFGHALPFFHTLFKLSFKK